MQHVGRVAFFPGRLIETGLIFVDEPLCGLGWYRRGPCPRHPPASAARRPALPSPPNECPTSTYGPGMDPDLSPRAGRPPPRRGSAAGAPDH